MRITPLVTILFGIYILSRKKKTQLPDDIYYSIYKLVGVFSILDGCFLFVYQNYLRTHSMENGYYDQLLFAKLTMGSILIGFFIIFALIEGKLQRRKKNVEKIKNKFQPPLSPSR